MWIAPLRSSCGYLLATPCLQSPNSRTGATQRAGGREQFCLNPEESQPASRQPLPASNLSQSIRFRWSPRRRMQAVQHFNVAPARPGLIPTARLDPACVDSLYRRTYCSTWTAVGLKLANRSTRCGSMTTTFGRDYDTNWGGAKLLRAPTIRFSPFTIQNYSEQCPYRIFLQSRDRFVLI